MTRQERFQEKAGRLAGLALAVAGTLALCLFAWFLFGGLSGQRRFTTWSAIAVYYVVPAAVAVLLFASLRLKPLARLGLLVAGVSFTVSIYIVELLLALASGQQASVFSMLDTQLQLQPVMTRLLRSPNKQQLAAELARDSGRPIDSRSPAEVLDDFRRNGTDAIPIMTATNDLLITHPDGTATSAVAIDGRELIPLGSVSGAVTLLCNESGEWISYRSDSRGFNNPDDVWRSDRVDVAALGDSFTHGYCVPGGSSFVDLIRQHDRATLNLGMAGDGPLMMLATLKEHLPRITPRIVLWFYYEGNDLVDLQTERKSALLTSYLRTDFLQPDLARQRDIDRAIVAEMPRLAAIAAENAAKLFRNTIRYRLTAFVKLTSVRDRLAPIAGHGSRCHRGGSRLRTGQHEDLSRHPAPGEGTRRLVAGSAVLRVSSGMDPLHTLYLPGQDQTRRRPRAGARPGDSDHRHRPGVPGARRPTVVVSVPRLRPLHGRRPSPGRRRSRRRLLE